MAFKIRRSLLLLGSLLLAANSSAVHGQGNASPRSLHRLHRGDMPPGQIGREQLIRSAAFHGYYQPVELIGPKGSQIALAVNGQFQKPQPSPVKVALLIGQVYRFKITGIPGKEGFEVFPTVELVNRLYPPPGKAARFPVPIQLTSPELELAINGRFVTRVIYLENPQNALALPENPDLQRFYEVGRSQDPLEVADGLGRPMAIMRMGSRVPAENEEMLQFTYGSPRFIPLPRLEDIPAGPADRAVELRTYRPANPRQSPPQQGRVAEQPNNRVAPLR